MIELLPCPFCGSEAVDRREIDGFPMIYCNGDGCFGPQTTARTFEDALIHWNTRVVPAQSGVSPLTIEAGAQALANDVWHPPQPLESLSAHDVNKFRRQARLVLEAASSLSSTELPTPAEPPAAVAYQRRNIGPDGTPWSSWYPANDEPTPENMKFDGYLSYEYRPLYPGSPLSRPEKT